jgi:hypothetical protein
MVNGMGRETALHGSTKPGWKWDMLGKEPEWFAKNALNFGSRRINENWRDSTQQGHGAQT